MASVNKVILVGHLGADPELASFSNGGRVANLRVATSQQWTDRASGERKERTEWHSIVISNDKLADVAGRFLRKGSKVYLEGQLRTRKWQDRDGKDRYTTEIVVPPFGGDLVLLDRLPSNRPPAGGAGDYEGPGFGAGSGGGGGAGADWGAGGAGGSGPGAFGDDLDDDVPF